MQLRYLVCFCALLAGCRTGRDPDRTDPAAPRELLEDPRFTQWLKIRGLGMPADDGEVQGVFRTEGKLGEPSWTIAQWASKHNLADPAASRQVRLGPHLFALTNLSKRVVVDTRRGEVLLGLSASACYDRPRQEGESWPHLLLSAPLTDTRYPKRICHVAELKRLDISFACRLDAFEDREPSADRNLHAAQFQLFLYVQNLKQGDDGFGDMMWFGIPVFDNRYPVREESFQRDGGKADASGKFIYSLPSKACLPGGEGFVREGRLLAGKDARWVDFSADVLPWIVYAFRLARKNGFFPSTDLEELYVSGLNVGWEMPGAYDAAMRLRGLSLVATPHPPPPLSDVQAQAARTNAAHTARGPAPTVNR
jgi:hypothetical protein